MNDLKLYQEREMTIVAQACANIQGFTELHNWLKQKVSISGKSQSMFNNYVRHVAKVALHFNCLPTKLDTDQINDYLYLNKEQHKTPSETFFKFTVYGLRFVFRMEGLKDKPIELPNPSINAWQLQTLGTIKRCRTSLSFSLILNRNPHSVAPVKNYRRFSATLASLSVLLTQRSLSYLTNVVIFLSAFQVQ